MIRVNTGSRLHFGLFSLPRREEESWPNRHGAPSIPARRFGGVGLMVEDPGIQLTLGPAKQWQAEGPLADRVLAFARQFSETTPELATACHVKVERAAPEHAGLGTGTQLALGVAHAVARLTDCKDLDGAALAGRVGRGERSALGIHGFARGGFLVEAGQRTPGTVAPLVARHDFPADWLVLLILPPGGPGLHGAAERLAFARLAAPATSWTDALCRLVLLGILPALVGEDIETFGEAVHEFNARVGEAFVSVQGGTYANASVAEVVRFVRQQGVRGVGQSSWGPAVFAVVADEERGADLARRVRKQFSLRESQVILTSARNRAAELRLLVS